MQLDITTQIAVQCPRAWIRLVQTDRDFYLFSQTAYDINLRNKHFANKMFGPSHRDSDLPSQGDAPPGPAEIWADVYAVVPRRQIYKITVRLHILFFKIEYPILILYYSIPTYSINAD